ncbi:MAG: hypothetical protein H6597_00570 [Flavobacteriales bacterium]|nr:hypothetical protein [Flavobacteriales bacterium]
MRSFLVIPAVALAVLVQGQVIDTVLFTPLGAFQFPYSVGTISQSAYSCKLDRMGRPYAYVCCRELGLVTFDISDPLMPVPTDASRPPIGQAGSGWHGTGMGVNHTASAALKAARRNMPGWHSGRRH